MVKSIPKCGFWSLLICTLSSMIACVSCGGDREPPGNISYDLQQSSSGSFAPLGAGEDPRKLESPAFGPEVGYPPPQSVSMHDFGVLGNICCCYIIFESAIGQLCEVVATIEGPGIDGELTVDAPLDAAGRIGIQIPTVLDSAGYVLQIKDPDGQVLIAEAHFELVDCVLGSVCPECDE